MRKISVVLDSYALKSLEEMTKINECSISDVVNTALIAFSRDKQPSIIKGNCTPWGEFKEKVGINQINFFCDSRGIDLARLRYLVNSVAKGGTVCGFGNTKNKYREKEDDRLFKTHTAWISYCLKEDLGINLEVSNE
jgi:hypothetical protein